MKGPASGRKLSGIYTRGNTFWFTYRLGGKKHYHSLETDDYGEAVRKALAIRQAPVLEPAAVFAREIEAFVAAKLRANEYSPRSAGTKIHALKELMAGCGHANPASVTTADVTKFYRRLQSRVEESTAQGYVATTRSFFNWLVAERKVRQNPVETLKLDRLDLKGRDRFCAKELRDQLLNSCGREDLRLVLFLGFHAGLRKTEIIKARPGWFDLERGLLTVRETSTFRPKDRQSRTIPLTKAFREFLVGYGLPEPFVLRPEVAHGAGIYRWDFRAPFRAHMKANGCPWVTPHVMRHTFASLLASAGVSIYKVATWLGDDVRVVQRHYAKLTPDDGDIEKAF